MTSPTPNVECTHGGSRSIKSLACRRDFLREGKLSCSTGCTTTSIARRERSLRSTAPSIGRPRRARRAIRAGNGWYRTVGQDIRDLEAYPELSVPVLGVSGISTPFLKAFLDRYAQHATMMEFKATGHWIPEERAAETTAAILEFLGQP